MLNHYEEKKQIPMKDGRYIIMPHTLNRKKEEMAAEKGISGLNQAQNLALFLQQTSLTPKSDDVKKNKPHKDKKKGKKKKHTKKTNQKKAFYLEDYEIHKHKGEKKAMKELKNLNYSEKNNNGGVMAEIMSYKEYFRVIKKELFMYNEETGLYEKTDKEKFGTMISRFLRDNTDYYRKYQSREIDEAYKIMLMNSSIQSGELTNAINKPYILCGNGVVQLDDECNLTKPSPEYEFTRYIHADYDEDADGKHFKKFIKFAAGNDKELINLLQEIMGYVFSNYNSLRKAIMIVGPKGTGKSLLLNIITELVGAENISAINLQDLDSEYNRGAVLNAAMNIVSDMPATPIKNELSAFKSLTSSLDKLSGRMPYGEPFTRECNTKLLFGSNEVPKLVGISAESVEAFYDRMIFIPFTAQVSDEDRDPNLVEHLKAERDYIFSWACEGMQRVIENNFKFSECKAAEKLKNKCWAKQYPAQAFVQKHIKRVGDGTFESSLKIKEQFSKYCDELNISYKNRDITSYLEDNLNLKSKKKKVRIDDIGKVTSIGNPISVYEGIRLK